MSVWGLRFIIPLGEIGILHIHDASIGENQISMFLRILRSMQAVHAYNHTQLNHYSIKSNLCSVFSFSFSFVLSSFVFRFVCLFVCLFVLLWVS